MNQVEEPQSDATEETEVVVAKPTRRSRAKSTATPEAALVDEQVPEVLDSVADETTIDEGSLESIDSTPEPQEGDVLDKPDEVLPETIEPDLPEIAEVAIDSETLPEEPKSKSKSKKKKILEPVVEEIVETPKPKKGFFGWLRGLFKSKSSTVADVVESEEIEPEVVVVPEGLVESDLELSPSAIKKELSKLRKEVREHGESRERLEAEVSTKAEQMAVFAEQVDQITAWASKVSRTFIWKVQEEMDRNLVTAKADMERHEAAVKNLSVIEPGRLLSLRKRFHKSLTWALVVCGGLIAIFSLIRFREEIPRFDWLAVLYDPNISGPILIFVLAMFVGLLIFFSRRQKAKAPKISKVIWSSLLAILVSWLIWDSSRQKSFMQLVVNPFVDRHYSEILTVLGSIWILWVLGSLISYYRDYSIFNREVDTQIKSLEGVIEGYVKTQQELSRLNLLYRQTNDWLEILANALYRPWKTNPEWGTSKEYTTHYDTFPFALRVAQAREGADARMQELERIIGSRLLTQGWRNDAFEDLVSQVGAEMGLPPGKFVVDLLDQDLPHQTNNSRALLKRFLVNSASNSFSGKLDLGSNSAPPQQGKVQPTDRYLVEVARKRLLDLIDKTQSVAISAARPRVEQIVDDPLLSLRADSAGVDEFDPTESWDEFLTDSLGADSVDESPLGVLSFTEEGRMKKLPSKVQSFVLVPKRLAKALPNISSDKITVVPLGDDRPRSLEIIARVDVVGPADLSSIAVLGVSGDKQKKASSKEIDSVEVEEEL